MLFRSKSRIIKLLNKKEKEANKKKLIEIVAKDRKNLVLEISNIFTKNGVNIESLKAKVKEQKAEIEIIVTIKPKDSITKLSEEILEINDTMLVKII